MPLPKKIPRSGGMGVKQKNGTKDGGNEKRVLANRYQVEKKLGSGNFGTAFLVKDLKLKNVEDPRDQLKVLKEIPVGELQPDETVDAMHEANLLRNLHHPGIVKFHDSFIDGEFFCLITEYCEGGDLDCKIKQYIKQKKTFREEQIVEWLIQLLLAVQYMHSRRVLHRDLKTRNIFLKNNMIKIGDFGISRILMGTTDMASTFTGTPYYMSPEVLKHEGYNSKSDVWSVGCMLYELTALKHAFDGQSLMGVMYKIVEGDLPAWPKQYSADLREIFTKILTKDPSQRPAASEVLKMPFIAEQIELLKNTMIDIHFAKEQKDSIKKETVELVTAVNQKTRVDELRQQGEEYKYKNMSPRERMRLRKQEEADRKAQQMHIAARKQLKENKKVSSRLRTSMNETQLSSWFDGNKKSATVHLDRYKTPDITEEDDDDDIIISNEGRPHTAPFPSRERIDEEFETMSRMDDRFAKTTDVGTVVQRRHSDDRPITPMKDRMVYDLSHSSLDFKEGIPDDPELANTFYSQFDSDFDSDEDSDSDEGTLLAEAILNTKTDAEMGDLIDVLRGALDKEDDDKNMTLTDDTVVGAFGPVARDRKIRNLRAECEKQLGKSEFEKAYQYLRKARFGGGEEKTDDAAIMKGLEKVVKNPRDCFIVDQLLFLEEQAKISSL